MATDLETPFSPCSFEFQPGSPDPSSQNTRIKQSFRFAGAPDGPLPSIPSGEEDDSEDSNEPEIVFRRKLISRPVEKPIKKSLNWKDFPFLSALACFLCVLGGIMYSVAIHSVADLILKTLLEVMRTSYAWFETAEILSTIAGCLIIALSLLIFSASCITFCHQNESNPKVQLVFIGLVYPALYVWGFFIFISIVTITLASILDGVCSTKEISHIWQDWNTNDTRTICDTRIDLQGEHKCINCIDLYQFHFVFPDSIRKEDMEICKYEIYELCDEELPLIMKFSIISLIGAVLTFLGITVHLFELSWTRTDILEQNKLKINRELRYIRSHVKSILHNRASSSDIGLMLLNKTRQE